MMLRKAYEERYATTLHPLAVELKKHLVECLGDCPRIDRVMTRPKSPESFVNKAIKKDDAGNPWYENPLTEIQDQLGARIITFYRDDVDRVTNIVLKYLRPIEEKMKMPQSEWEFGYFGKHFLLFIPPDIIDPNWLAESVPTFFELQIKTLFQHAWSEANHDLGYKTDDGPFLPDEKRLLAFASAQAWGADRIFDDLFQKRQIGLRSP